MALHKITAELLQDIAHLGRRGAIIEVSAPQARNALIPQGIAKEVTPERLKKIESDKKREQDQARMRLEQAFEIQKQLDGREYDFVLRGKGSKVFGGLDEHAISTRIMDTDGVKFEKSEIKLPTKGHIKTAGRHMIYLHITRDTLAKIWINVSVSEGK